MKTKLYQVFYEDNQPLDQDCVPVDARGVDVKPLYENYHILNAYKDFTDADYYGLVSWRLREKTDFTKKDIDTFIKNNQVDVVHFYSNSEHLGNPLAFNMKLGTDIGNAVKRIIELGLFKRKAGLEKDWVNIYANYFVAKKEVWDKYIPVLEKAIKLCKTDPVLVELLKKPFRHRRQTYPLMCFVLEYMIGLFLADNPEITHAKIGVKPKRRHDFIGTQMDLMEIYQRNKAPGGFGDKGTLHHYIESYGKIFHEYREKPITFLEIGVCRGDSLRMWREFFPVAKVIGIDINEPTLDITGCEFHICDQFDKEALESTFKDVEFDIVIDDGSHLLEHMIFTHKVLFDKVKKGGLYIIEDVGGVTRETDKDIQILKGELGDCEVIDTRHISKRYDDILMVWKKLN